MKIPEIKYFTPFELLPDEAQQMFEEDLPAELTLVITIFPDTSEHEVHGCYLTPECAQLAKVFELPEADPKRFGIASDITIIAPGGCTARPPADLPAKQRKWFHENLYVQIGFAETPKCIVLAHKLGTVTMVAMTFYDAAVALYESTEPKDHFPFGGTPEDTDYIWGIVNNFYRIRIAIWNRGLLQYRTALMVMMRAVLMGRDPAQEYHRFVNAGGKYFLDYPTLCA
jgi:hypothetical protein